MSDGSVPSSMTRRDLLRMIGITAGGAAMYQAMTALGFARESKRSGPIDLSGAPKGASVLILGAGMAGLTAAYELRNAGYKVQVLEYNARAGGRNWSLRGGDTYTELGGATQHCQFDEGHLHQSGAVADSVSPRAHAALLPRARRQAASRSSRSITTRTCTTRTRSAASRSASALTWRISTARSPSCSPNRCRSTASMRR